MSNWDGQAIGPRGLARILNAGGCRAPLIWCYNSELEFPRMAACLGADQPVIGLRSLNMIERLEPLRQFADRDLADLYTTEIQAHFGDRLTRCHVGGNCQGLPVASRLAANLRLEGIGVESLLVMESRLDLPFPATTGFIYGERSHDFNPFLKGESPQARWAMLFRDASVEIIPGGHGEYFSDENLGPLCEAVERILRRGEAAVAPQTSRGGVDIALVEEPAMLEAGASIALEVRRTSADCVAPPLRDLRIGAIWISAQHAPFVPLDFVRVPEALDEYGIAQIRIAVPPSPGRWELTVFACREGEGPVSWRENWHPRGHVDVA